MANFTAGTSFSDGVTNDVTAAKLNALVADAVPTSNLSLNSTTGTISNFTASTANVTLGTIPTLTAGTTTSTAATITSATITTGTIPTLVATTLVTTGTGTAAAPAIVPTGDTNTGLFFPAADTLAATTQGTERLRVDSSGNVGIGTTSPSNKLDVQISSATAYSSGATGNALRIYNSSSSDNQYCGIIFQGEPTSGNAGISSIYGITPSSGNSTLVFSTRQNSTLAERLRIDSSGNVGIGNTVASSIVTASGIGPLVVGQGNGNYGMVAYSGTTHFGALYFADGTTGADTYRGYVEYKHGDEYLRFGTNATERLRIDSSGNVGIGCTPTDVNSFSKCIDIRGTSTTNRGGVYVGNSDSTVRGYIAGGGATGSVFVGTQTAHPFLINTGDTERLRITSGGEVYIAGTTDQGAYNLQVNGTGVWGAGAYVNGSDSRIKEDIQPLASGLDVVEKLNPVTYRYKQSWSSDQSIQSGFIAQELLAALDGQIYVNGVVQQGGAEGYYSVAYQNLIAVLTKAIQELKAENDSLKSRVSALEAA